jgi:hypothetical protein
VLFRVLLALVTGLLVARPIVLGEDPGLLDPLSDQGGLVLTLLWFLAGTGWAAWRLWAGQERAQGGFVEIGWLGVVVLMFVSAAVAATYKHPAWLIAWEWVALLLGFVLVRQLFTSEDAQQGLLSALLAGVVTLSIFGIWQGLVDLPDLARRIADLPISEAMRKRVLDGHVYTTYAHPNAFAGYLALLLPALVGAAYVAHTRRAVPLVRHGAVVFAVLGVWALWLTHSRGALAALLLAGGAAAAWAWRRWLLDRRLGVGVGVVVLGGLGFLVVSQGWLDAALGKETSTASVRLEYWKATWKMIEDHPWLGVGPGNFGRAYPRYMSPQADETITDPHNLVLELWATAGPLAVACLGLAVLAFFLAPWFQRTEDRGQRSEDRGQKTEDREQKSDLASDAAEPRFRWEFYLGGMLGLILSFLLRVGPVLMEGGGGSAGEKILGEGVLAAIRSLLWFMSFAILERIDWPARLRGLVLTTGVGALLLNLLVSGGISLPSVACLLLAVMALALNAWGYWPLSWLRQSRVLLTIPVPVLAGLSLIYFATVFYPVTGGAALTRRALTARRYLLARNPNPVTLSERTILARNLHKAVIPTLREAVELDAGNASLALDLAKVLGQIWTLTPKDESPGKQALDWAGFAIRLDPESRNGYQTLYELHMFFAYGLEHQPVSPGLGMLFGGAYQVSHLLRLRAKNLEYQENLKKAREQHRIAAEALARYLVMDPWNVEVRFLVARACFDAGDLERARQQALETLVKNETVHPSRKLTDAQREYLTRWMQGGAAP